MFLWRKFKIIEKSKNIQEKKAKKSAAPKRLRVNFPVVCRKFRVLLLKSFSPFGVHKSEE